MLSCAVPFVLRSYATSPRGVCVSSWRSLRTVHTLFSRTVVPRHYKFAHQYFTRTTVNCEEDPTERLVYDEVQNRKNKRRRGKPRMARVAVPSSNQEEGAVGASDTSDVGAGGGKAPASAAATRNGEGAAGAGVAAATTTGKPKPEDVYIPVRCCTCSTEVGVRDCDGGTHLFNVLPSHESRAR